MSSYSAFAGVIAMETSNIILSSKTQIIVSVAVLGHYYWGGGGVR